ncbi:MAG: hypothetical protein CRU78_08780 [Candidatus Accumulibacter phosphatis]|uniref:Uncharacterized protein n=1 Tax=Candidatus Accumulibacter phosphatis TaxID=327160 RepID=A0A6A7RU37_9PROT|nr:hypothetical protein [Candidatus Accumulibacter phosphatis]
MTIRQIARSLARELRLLCQRSSRGAAAGAGVLVRAMANPFCSAFLPPLDLRLCYPSWFSFAPETRCLAF